MSKKLLTSIFSQIYMYFVWLAVLDLLKCPEWQVICIPIILYINEVQNEYRLLTVEEKIKNLEK